MLIKLDENLGERGRQLFADAGHDVSTVKDQGLAGAVEPGAERVSGAHPERISGTHLLLEDGRSGQGRQTAAHSDFRGFLLFIDSRKR
jgi:hypothetical protein